MPRKDATYFRSDMILGHQLTSCDCVFEKSLASAPPPTTLRGSPSFTRVGSAVPLRFFRLSLELSRQWLYFVRRRNFCSCRIMPLNCLSPVHESISIAYLRPIGTLDSRQFLPFAAHHGGGNRPSYLLGYV